MSLNAQVKLCLVAISPSCGYVTTALADIAYGGIQHYIYWYKMVSTTCILSLVVIELRNCLLSF